MEERGAVVAAPRIGIDVGPAVTAWATVALGPDRPRALGAGTVPTVIALAPGGRVVAADEVTIADPGTLRQVTGRLTERLGEVDPVVLGGVPFGVDALLARVLDPVLRRARSVIDDRPAPYAAVAVALAHDDDLDLYRQCQLVEAVRQAGIPVEQVVLVARRAARAARSEAGMDVAGDVGDAAGAALARTVADDVAPGPVGLAGVAAAAALTGAVSAAAVLRRAAAAGGAGPVGTPLGSGPVGTPLGSGPVGTPLDPARPSVRARLGFGVGAVVTTLAVAGVGLALAGGSPAPSTTPPPAAVPSPSAPAVSAPAVSAPAESAPTTPAPATSATDRVPPVATVRAPSTGVAACALGRWTLDGSSWSRLLGGIAAAEGVGGSVAPGAVTGDATMEVTADRLTTTYRNWTFRFQAAGATVSITLDGTEVAAGGFRADGTMSFTDIADAVTVSATATADGTTIAIPSTPRSAGLGSGAGTFACGSGRLTMQIADGLPPLVLVRPA